METDYYGCSGIPNSIGQKKFPIFDHHGMFIVGYETIEEKPVCTIAYMCRRWKERHTRKDITTANQLGYVEGSCVCAGYQPDK